jgi:Trypsin-co-occurring domain 2
MIELAEVIRQLRQELDLARTSATGEVLQFEMGTIELEVMVALEKDISAGLKVRFWVVDLGADTRAVSSSTHRIRLTLQPTVPTASPHPDPGSRVSAYISGGEVAGER